VSILDEEHYRNIIGLLKEAQKGLTIEEISKKLNLSRITTTKYLNSLFVSGQVNMRKLGPAKVFTLSARLPAEQILSQSSDLILILDESHIIRQVSESFLLAFGISKDQLENQKIGTTFIGPDLIDRIRDPVKKAMAGKESVVNAWIPVQKERRAFRIRIIPLAFGWGDKGVAVMLEDRTGEILAQEENALLADLLNASPAAITVIDFQGHFLYSNKKNLDLHGYSLSEFLNLDLSHIDTPESEKLRDERFKELKKAGELSFEVAHFRKDGEKIPLEVHAKMATWGDRDVSINIATDISERKRAERALKESERRFADIINFLPDATLVVNSEGIVIAWNRAIEELTGVKAGDIIGKGDYAYATAMYGERRPFLLDLIFNNDPDVRKYYRELQKEGSTFTTETILTPPNAGERIVWLKASPLFDKDGRIAGAIESIRDITERKRAEEELRESEQKFATVFLSNPVSQTLVSATDGVFIDVNDSFLIHTGYTREEIIGKTSEELGIFVDNNEYARMVSLIQNQHHVHGMELQCRLKTGEIRTCRFSSSVILMSGNPHVLSTVDDVTERKKVESAVLESRERYRLILENANDGILVNEMTPEGPGKFIDANDQACRILGMTREEMQDVRLVDLDTPEMNERAPGIFREIVRNNRAFFRTNYRTKDNQEKFLDISVSLFDLNSRPTMLSVVRDITDRKLAGNALRESEKNFRSIVEYALEGILITDLLGNVLFANPAAACTLECEDCAGLIGRNVMEFVAPESKKDVIKDFDQVAHGHDGYLAHYRVISAKGREISVESIGKVIMYEGKQRDLISFRTIPEPAGQ
jgi:PAS domain S-box-containing protein